MTEYQHTNDKIRWFCSKNQTNLKWFAGIDEFVNWYNYDRLYDLWDQTMLEILAKAFVRKMAKKDEVIKDECVEEIYHVR